MPAHGERRYAADEIAADLLGLVVRGQVADVKAALVPDPKLSLRTIAELITEAALGLMGGLMRRKDAFYFLPLIGTCDWNDGMNRVGRLGRGESWARPLLTTRSSAVATSRAKSAATLDWPRTRARRPPWRRRMRWAILRSPSGRVAR